MSKFYKDYVWKEGLPHGIQPVEGASTGSLYKIVMDPYRKRISIENYLDGLFSQVIYDSYLINFRHLNPANQTAWQKEELPSGAVLIRDQDDRIVFKENYIFKNELCRECHISSPHNIPLATQKMFYKVFGDSFDGVILFDKNDHPVMQKIYAFDETTHQFTELLKENWNLSH